MRASGLAVACLLLSACGGEESPTTAPAPVGGTPSTVAPAPAPAPPPAPAPSPSSSALDDGKTVLCIEGDSISVDYVGYYAGYFKQQHPSVETRILAVGGSSVVSLVNRRDALLALNCDITTVFIGANDLGSQPSAQAYVDKILAYVQPIRARGTKVLVATNIPIYIAANPTFTANHNLLKDQVAGLLKAQVGKTIDGVIDFAAHPVMGQINAATNPLLFSDGVHPTDLNARGDAGHNYLYEVYRLAVEPVLPRQ